MSIGMIFSITLPALACEPPPLGFVPPTLDERINAATFVLEGSIEQEHLNISASAEESFIFTVHKWFKGNGPAKVIIKGFGDGPDCLNPPPSPFKKAILFLNGNLASHGELELNYLGAHDAVIQYDETNASITEEITRIVGTAPILPKTTDTTIENPNFSTQTNTLQIPELTVDQTNQYYNVEIEFNFDTERFNLKKIDTRPDLIVNAILAADFKLRIGQTAKFTNEKLRVTFIRVAEDSRCPINVTCVWAGQITVVLQFALENQKQVEIKLTQVPGRVHAYAIVFNEYQVELVAVAPQPQHDSPPTKLEYEITLNVFKQIIR